MRQLSFEQHKSIVWYALDVFQNKGPDSFIRTQRSLESLQRWIESILRRLQCPLVPAALLECPVPVRLEEDIPISLMVVTQMSPRILQKRGLTADASFSAGVNDSHHNILKHFGEELMRFDCQPMLIRNKRKKEQIKDTNSLRACLTARDSPENVFVRFSGFVCLHATTRAWKSALEWVLSSAAICTPPPPPLPWCTLVYLYVDVGGALDLRVRVQTARRSSFPPFIPAAVPWSLMKAPSIIGPTEWFLCESIKPHPLFFMRSFLFPPTYVTFVSQSIPVLTHNSSLLSSRGDAVE